MILAGDIGGTWTRLGWFEAKPPHRRLVEARYPSQDFPSFPAILAGFRAQHPGTAVAAAFGVAGPVHAGRSQRMYLPWEVEESAIRSELGTASAWLVNDLEATAWSIALLGEEARVCLQGGEPAAVGNRAVIAAGTGLGEAGLFWDGKEHHPFATEGGHATLSLYDGFDMSLFARLEKRYGHVSTERLVSGAGLVNLYEFLVSLREGWVDSVEVEEAIRRGEGPAAIAEAGAAGRTPLTRQALSLWARRYGAEAGNLALKLMATGGVYVAGGMAPKNAEFLQRGEFLEAFLAKGRMRPVLERIPVYVVTDESAPLRGAARCALRRCA